MSKPTPVDPAHAPLEPDEQMRCWLDLYRAHVDEAVHARLVARAGELKLAFTPDELVLLAALDTPARVQEFLNTQIYYNNDHASAEQDETAMPPRQVLRTAHAHCFEGALFAYAVNYMHGHEPRWVLLEASQDPDHNLVVVRDSQTGRLGANAHSAWPHLDGRPSEYETLAALVDTYIPWYISDLTHDPHDLTLVGYSDPFDLTTKFGTAWIGSLDPVWDIYYTYVDDTARFHYLGDASAATHFYPLVRALQEGWITFDAGGKPRVGVENLPPAARAVWDEFWRAFDPPALPPRGRAREREKEFMRLTGTTPVDLRDNADDFQYYLAAGYRVEHLLTR
jgi:hypothetical protein